MDGYVTIGTELDTKSFDAQIDYVKSQMEDIEDKLKKADMGFEVGDVQKLEAQYEKLTDKLRNLVKQKEEFNKADLSSFQTSLQGTSKSIESIIKKVTRWGLAVFGIRSAYMAVRSAINTIAGDDEQLKADIDYMKSAIAYTLEPVVRKIVELAKQLLFYIGYLIKSWTGYNIFENANKSLRKSVGSAKELKKQLAGFDEMNVLSDNSSSSGGGGATPSFDLSSFENVETPEWLLVIEKVGKWILDNWEDVVMQLLLVKLVIDLLTGNWIGVIIDLIGFFLLAIPKIWDAIKVVIENLQIIFAMIVAWIYAKVITPVKKFFTDLWQGIINGVTNAVNWVINKFKAIVSFFSNLISSIVNLFKTIGIKVGNAIGSAFKTVVNGVLKAIESILNFPIKQINKLINVINKVPGINIGTLPTFSLPRLAKGGVINMPGRGVPVGNAIAGERGQEGVIPLTDSQQMALLGEAIGKYITINANITNTMNGRVISKELQRVQNDSDFAYNR
jgi:phage-related protein